MPNIYCDVDCRLPDKFKDLVNSPVTAITDQLVLENDAARRQWDENGRLGVEPHINVYNWIKRVRRLRIFSIFPVLGTLEATKNLELTGAENKKKGWVSVAKKYLYNFVERNLFYERHIE